MFRIVRLITLMFLGLSLSSCLLPNEKGKVSLSLSSSDQAARDAGRSVRATVTDVKLIDDQIIITGADLDGVIKAKVTQSGADSVLSIIAQSASELILSSSSKVALALNTLMTLTLEDAYGATVVEVTFNLPDSSVSTAKIGDAQVTTAKIADGAITAAKLSQMSAQTGQLLRWNGTTWVASDLDALTYAGTWDASVGGSPNPSAVGGEYYIVSNGGTSVDPGDGNPRDWDQGDWIIYNATTSTWDQIRNTSDVTSFNGRTGGVTPQAGDYTWAQIDKTTSSIGDIGDIDLSIPPTAGKILKYDGSKWAVSDDLSSGGAGSVSSSEIADDTIVDADVSAAAAIAQSKIAGLTTSLDSKLDDSQLDTTTSLGTSDSLIPSQNAVKTYVDTATTNMMTSFTGGAGLTDGPIGNGGTIDVNTDNSTIEVVADNLQVKDGGITDAKLATGIAQSKITNLSTDLDSKLDDTQLDTTTTLGTSDSLIPSQNAVKTYVDAQVSGVNASQWTTIGSDIYFNTGRVGIGTTSPIGQFNVMTELSSPSSIDPVDNPSVYIANPCVLGSSASSSNECVCYGGYTYNDLNANNIFDALECIENDPEVVITEGKIGVGTNAPTKSIHINGNGGILITPRVQNDYSADPAAAIINGTMFTIADTAGILQDDKFIGIELSSLNSGGYNQSAFLGVVSNTLGRTPDIVIGQRVGGSKVERARIDENGNFGIGTLTPATKLDVNGTITATGFSGPISSSGVSADAGTAPSPSYTFSTDTDTGFYTETADTIEVSVGGTNIFDMSAAGIVSSTTGGGVMTSAAGSASNPTFSFAGDTDTGWYSPAADTLAAGTAGVERIRINSSGRVGIGTSNPQTIGHIVVPSTSGFNDGGLFVDGSSGANDTILKVRGGATPSSLSDADSIFTVLGNGEVGINTVTPESPLHVITKRATGYNDGGIIVDAHSGSSDHVFKVRAGSDPTSLSDTNTKMVVLGTGNVGIGTTAPSQKLHILASGANNSNVIIEQSASGTNDPYLSFVNGVAANNWSIGLDDSDSDSFKIASSTSLDTDTHLTISPAGNVGIGTTAPKSNLQIGTAVNLFTAGLDNLHFGRNIYYDGSYKRSIADNDVSFMFMDGAGDTTFYSNSDVNTTVDSVITLQSNMTIKKSGNVGVGTTTPSSKLQIVETSGSNFALEVNHSGGTVSRHGVKVVSSGTSSTSSILKLESDSNNNIMHVRADGYVGIGTTSPSKTLDVTGTSGATLSATGGAPNSTTNTNWLRAPKGAVSLFVGDNDSVTGYTVDESSGNIRYNGTGVAWGDIGYYPQSPATDEGHFRFSRTASSINSTPNAKVGVGSLYSAGNVGIGTTSPVSKLDLGSNNSDPSTYPNKISLWSGGTNNYFGFGVSTGDLDYFTQSNHRFHVGYNGTAGSEAMSILSSGNVGIGTTSPAHKLDVNGDINTTGSYLTNGADYAEYFMAEEKLMPGDLVGLNAESGLVRLYQSGDTLLGVVSTKAGVIGNMGLYKSENSVLVGLMGQLPVNNNQVSIIDRKVKTLDGQSVGTLLASGDIYVNISSRDTEQSRDIASLKQENIEMKSENAEIKKQLKELKSIVEKLSQKIQ